MFFASSTSKCNLQQIIEKNCISTDNFRIFLVLVKNVTCVTLLFSALDDIKRMLCNDTVGTVPIKPLS